MSFRHGQQVVCIVERWCTSGFEKVPVKGGVYTIRTMHVTPWQEPRCGLRLEEIVRPVKKTDISTFTKMLKRKPKRVSEPV